MSTCRLSGNSYNVLVLITVHVLSRALSNVASIKFSEFNFPPVMSKLPYLHSELKGFPDSHFHEGIRGLHPILGISNRRGDKVVMTDIGQAGKR